MTKRIQIPIGIPPYWITIIYQAFFTILEQKCYKLIIEIFLIFGRFAGPIFLTGYQEILKRQRITEHLAYLALKKEPWRRKYLKP
jgi:hypothetical protein